MDNSANYVELLRESVAILDNTIAKLRDSTKTTKNLQRILTTRHVYDIIPKQDLKHARKHFKSLVNPEIQLLIDQAQSRVHKLQKKNLGLTSKINLNDVRLSKTPISKDADSPKKMILSHLRIRKMRLKQSLGYAQK